MGVVGVSYPGGGAENENFVCGIEDGSTPNRPMAVVGVLWPVNKMGLNVCILGSRHVLVGTVGTVGAVGTRAPKVLGAKHISNPDVASF